MESIFELIAISILAIVALYAIYILYKVSHNITITNL